MSAAKVPLSGCGTFDPRPDGARAARLVQEEDDMCEYCGCQSLDAIAELTREHTAALDLIRQGLGAAERADGPAAVDPGPGPGPARAAPGVGGR